MVNGKDISETIFNTLKNEILDLSIMPGQEMSENSVCERFNASRTPVHVALQRLADTGLLEIIPYKGVRATLLRFDDIRQMIYMRCFLETKVIGEFSKLEDLFALEDCEHNLRKQQIMLSSPDCTSASFYRQDSLFHKIWFDRVALPKIWEGIQDSEVHYTRFRMLDIVEMHQLKEIVTDHMRMLELIKAKNTSDIEALITYHLFGGIRRMSDKLTSEFAPYFEDYTSMRGFLETVKTFERP
jgi:DNA-binding GntR family transcriptional regulator